MDRIRQISAQLVTIFGVGALLLILVGSVGAAVTGAPFLFWVFWVSAIGAVVSAVLATMLGQGRPTRSVARRSASGQLMGQQRHLNERLPFVGQFASGHTDTAERAEELLAIIYDTKHG